MSRDKGRVMADLRGRPIHEVGPATTPHVPADVDPDAPKCVGCGRYHGSIGEGDQCLIRTIHKLRREVADLRLAMTIEDRGGS